MPRYEARCPTCKALVDSYELEGGWTATFPGAVATPSGRLIDGHQVGTGETPAEIHGVPPRITSNSDFDVLTLHPCGHALRGPEIRQFQVRVCRQIPKPLDLITPDGDLLKAEFSGAAPGVLALFIADGTTGAATVLDREGTEKLRDWLSTLLEETA